ncbi:hypothetical protein HYS31_00700 [Candidatus Woesearchaeota archaeon]|nr:hypothetical protein [Candidatus Woesearchaeota archaeon]
MKNMEQRFLASITCLLIFLSACTLTSSGASEQNFRTGNTGLALELLKNTPPPRMFEGDTFPVVIRVANTGAFDIPPEGAVLSLGVEKDYTKEVSLLYKQDHLTPDTANDFSGFFGIKGKSMLSPRGEEEVFSYNVIAGKLDPQSEQHISTITASVCYPYETILDTTICIDTDVNSLRPGKKVCSNQDIIFGNGQGAPVAITKIEPKMLPIQAFGNVESSDKIKPQFLIYVEDFGGGVVIKKESLKKSCIGEQDRPFDHNDFGIVYVKVELSGKELHCQLEKKERDPGPGHIKLQDKKDIIRCNTENNKEYLTVIDRSQDSYFAPLRITLEYGYTKSISASYTIQKPVS